MPLKIIFVNPTTGKKTIFEKPWPWGAMVPALNTEVQYTDTNTNKVYIGTVFKIKWDMGIEQVTIRVKEKE